MNHKSNLFPLPSFIHDFSPILLVKVFRIIHEEFILISLLPFLEVISHNRSCPEDHEVLNYMLQHGLSLLGNPTHLISKHSLLVLLDKTLPLQEYLIQLGHFSFPCLHVNLLIIFQSLSNVSLEEFNGFLLFGIFLAVSISPIHLFIILLGRTLVLFAGVLQGEESSRVFELTLEHIIREIWIHLNGVFMSRFLFIKSLKRSSLVFSGKWGFVSFRLVSVSKVGEVLEL